MCKGDSGGALLCNIDGQITFSGVLSRKKPFEESCGVEGNPGVFNDLYYFSQWIQTGAFLNYSSEINITHIMIKAYAFVRRYDSYIMTHIV